MCIYIPDPFTDALLHFVGKQTISPSVRLGFVHPLRLLYFEALATKFRTSLADLQLSVCMLPNTPLLERYIRKINTLYSLYFSYISFCMQAFLCMQYNAMPLLIVG